MMHAPCTSTMLLSTLVTVLSAGLTVAALPGPFRVQHPEETYDIDHGLSTGRMEPAQWKLDGFDRFTSPPRPPTESHHKSIYDILSDNSEFSHLLKLVNFSGDVADILKDTSTNITFFAPPNWALRPPHHRREDSLSSSGFHDLMQSDPNFDLLRALHAIESHDTPSPSKGDGVLDGDDDEDKERRKRVLQKIVRAVLLYHIIPAELNAHTLAVNITHATNLTFPGETLGGQPLRLRIASGPPIIHGALTVNFYAKIIKPDVSASNGVIHVINHPLLPPTSIFEELFNFPDIFSTVTSAVQRVHLTKDLDWRYVPEKDHKGSFKGTPALTFFAPSNSAFRRLPEKLRLFLFSPFGEHVLKKLLAFHAVPDFILHTDYAYNVTSDSEVFMDINAIEHNAPELTLPSHCGTPPSDWHPHPPSGHDIPLPPPHGMPHRPDHPHDPQDDGIPPEPPLPFFGFHRGPHHSDSPPGPPHSDFPCGPHGREPPRDHPMSDFPHGLPRPFPGGRAPHPELPRGAPMSEHPRGPRRPPQGQLFSESPHRPHTPPIGLPLSSAPPGAPGGSKLYALNYTLPTLLSNSSLHVHVVKRVHKLPLPGPHHPKSYTTEFFVNGQPVFLYDIPARNGAVHVIGKVLNPRAHSWHGSLSNHHDESRPVWVDNVAGDWDDWESWLPAWADEQ